MTFAAPLFLLATLAAVIPVILHLINRQKVKDLPFPTLRFLKISVEKTRRRRRLHDVLLMLLRAGVFILIALGLARPAMTNLATLFGGGANLAVAIILDNSASMGTIDQDKMRFDTATNAARQVLDQLDDGDQVAFYLTSGPAFPEEGKLDRTEEKALQMLAQCKLSYERADLAVELRQARKLLASSKAPNKQIFVITDNQRLSWRGLEDEADARVPGAAGASAAPSPAGVPTAAGRSGGPAAEASPEAAEPSEEEGTDIPIILVDCHRAPKPNAALRDVVLTATVPVAGVPVKATVEVENTASVAQSRVAEVHVDGAKEGASPELKLDAGAKLTHDFVFTFKQGGLHKGEARLTGDDGLKLDDRRFFALEVDQEIPVAVVKAQRHEIPYLEDTYYLERALSPAKQEGWAIRTTTLVASDLLGEPLDTYKLVYCVNLPALETEAAQRLAAYVARGGNVVWVCGPNVDPAAYNRMNEVAGGKLLPAPLLDLRAAGPAFQRDSWTIGFLDRQHPALGHLVEPASLYQSVLVYRHARVDAAASAEASVLARLDDGEPLLVERAVERGKVLLLGTGVHAAWTNLPLRPIFLPLVVRLSFQLAGAELARHQLFAGAPIVLNLDDEVHQVGVEVLPPSGATLRLKSEPVEGSPGQTFRYADTHDVGIYVLRLIESVRPRQIAFAVNLDPEESSTEKIPNEELATRLRPAVVVFAENPDDLSSTFKLLREGRSLWGAFLTGVLVLLVFEVLISNRLSPAEEPAAKTPYALRRPGVGSARPAVATK